KPPSVLLEVEQHAVLGTVLTDTTDPVRVHGPDLFGVIAELTTYHQAADCWRTVGVALLEPWCKVQFIQQWLYADALRFCRDFYEMIQLAIRARGLHGNGWPDVSGPVVQPCVRDHSKDVLCSLRQKQPDHL